MIFFVHLKYKQNIKPMKISETSHTALVAALKEALGRYMGNEENAAVTDIHLQPRQDSGELLLFNDDDEELARTVVASGPIMWGMISIPRPSTCCGACW